MTIVQKEEELFTRWAAKYENFVKDGAVDESEYMKSPRRILFILKEVNDPNGKSWDLREFLRGGGAPSTWDNVTRWIKGIRQLGKDIPWSDLADITVDDRKRELRSICSMNLKKVAGGNVTNNKELEYIAGDDAEYIQTQIALYDANLIICCGSITARLVREFLGLKDSPYEKTTRGVIYHKNNHGRIIVDYYHPEARVADNLLYYGLMDALREIIKTG